MSATATHLYRHRPTGRAVYAVQAIGQTMWGLGGAVIHVAPGEWMVTYREYHTVVSNGEIAQPEHRERFVVPEHAFPLFYEHAPWMADH